MIFKNLNIALGLSEDEIVSDKEGKATFYGQDYHFKSTTIVSQKARKIVIKINWRQKPNWRLNELGLNTNDRKLIQQTLKLKKGLIIVSGKENSGKSALLSALGKELLKQNKSIYFLYNQEKPEIDGLNFNKLSAKNLNILNKHNPDIVIIDELENDQLLAETFRLADKGYLIIASYRANSLKEVGKRAQQALGTEKNKLEALRLGIFTELKRMDRQTGQKRDKRKLIGNFKLIAFIK